ncbi:MAG TPA: MBL fold metallo-hydrolase [Bacteroidetes bacterium]|nr:MBL fold metallo-hydrolase [Bacteroidota bacterium]
METKETNYIQFLGAAGTVTGSKYLLHVEGYHLLIDSGLFQGYRELRRRNWMDFHFPPKDIDAIILTHGHLDHTGYLPRLVKQGFHSPIYCTEPTADLTEIILKDSAKLQEEDAYHANQKGYTKHSPAVPLYDLKDVEKTLPHLRPQPAEEFIELNKNIRFRFRKNAHIPGAAFIEMDIKGKRFVFSGDIGRPDDPMLAHREYPEKADVLFTESTYGDRLHPADKTEDILKEIIDKTLEKNGPLFVSSFAVDRAQDFMYAIWKMKKEGKIPDLPVYLDSPMGTNVSLLFLKYPQWLSMKPEVFAEVFQDTRLVTSIKETYRLAKDKSPKIVISGSGMMNGGRILHYLEMQLGNPAATFILPGYQAAGTRGRQLSEGVTEVKLHGRYFQVRAGVEHITTMSSHADQRELLSWMGKIKQKPEKVFIVHGEPQSADALRVKIAHELGWQCTIPAFLEKVPLDLD